ncbi:MAG: smalltalk protein [Prevotella sp.]|nr:smalltalk protein [Prevotella sp.]MBQ7425973.1 smalltalk protein [Prevotella sp.]MBR0265619.1 smalltalk protein [Prevotella sp.]
MKKKEMLKIGLQIAASIISALLTALGVVSCR